MGSVKAALTFLAQMALAISPALVGALWLLAGYAASELGLLGLLGWEIPTLAASLHLAWSGYASTKEQIEMSGLSEEELMQRYQEGKVSFAMGPTMVFGVIWMAISSSIGRNWFLQTLTWLSTGILALEGAVVIMASWLGAGMLLGEVLGMPGMIIGCLVPMLLFFYWLFEADKLRKAHPECVGGT